MASETTTEAGHGAAEHAQGMPQLDFSTFPNQIFWLVVTLLVIYYVLNKVALPRINSVLTDRHLAISNDLEQAEEFKRKAEEAEAAYEAALVSARSEAQRIVGEAKAEIQQDLDIAIQKADAEIAVKAGESEAAIQEIRDGSVRAIGEVANETAAEIIGAVMPAAGSADAVKAAVAARMKG